MLLHETVELLFSAIAAPFNPSFERDAAKARHPQLYVSHYEIFLLSIYSIVSPVGHVVTNALSKRGD